MLYFKLLVYLLWLLNIYADDENNRRRSVRRGTRFDEEYVEPLPHRKAKKKKHSPSTVSTVASAPATAVAAATAQAAAAAAAAAITEGAVAATAVAGVAPLFLLLAIVC